MLRRVVASSADVQRCTFAFLSVLLEQDPRSPTFLHTLHLGPVLLGGCFFQHSMAEEAAESAAVDAPAAIGLFRSYPVDTSQLSQHACGYEGSSPADDVATGATATRATTATSAPMGGRSAAVDELAGDAGAHACAVREVRCETVVCAVSELCVARSLRVLLLLLDT